MGRSKLGSLLRKLTFLSAATVVLVGAGTQAAQVSADSNATNNKTIAQMRLQQAGTSTTSGGGVATSGPAIAFDHVSVPQINVQVVAGGPQTETVSTQNATNNLTVNQGTAAMSGDTDADGGVATSGPAIAGSIVVGAQINVQVIACPNATGPITQTATNDATVNQLTGAVSGDATATGTSSDAHSGAAHALSIAVIRQRNVQIYRCNGMDGGGTATQTAANTAVVDQTSIGVSGNAGASDGGSARTGRVRSGSFSKVSQSNTQHASD